MHAFTKLLGCGIYICLIVLARRGGGKPRLMVNTSIRAIPQHQCMAEGTGSRPQTRRYIHVTHERGSVNQPQRKRILMQTPYILALSPSAIHLLTNSHVTSPIAPIFPPCSLAIALLACLRAHLALIP